MQKKWRYKQVRYNMNLDDGMEEMHMNGLGGQGWELVSVILQNEFSRVAYFKMAIENDNDKETLGR
ncbi:MAG: hypothetical protein OK454_00755 [Thaumarchaeota archaeon]|nr:hypothetical protein [Nitrososphaerota archaeon]